MKTKITKKSPIQWGKVIVIEDLYANEATIKSFEENLKASRPEITPEEVNREIQNLVMKDNFYNKLMDEISSCYDFEFDAGEVKEKAESFKATHADSTEEQLTAMSKINIVKRLIYDDLALQWGIEVTDEMAKTTLENFYKTTGSPIREYLTDRQKFENIKLMIIEQIISERLMNAFKGEFKLQKNPKS